MATDLAAKKRRCHTINTDVGEMLVGSDGATICCLKRNVVNSGTWSLKKTTQSAGGSMGIGSSCFRRRA